MQRLEGDRGWLRSTSEQPPYSMLARGIESEVLPTCRRLGVRAIVWAPLNGGWLTGKSQLDTSDGTARASRQPDHFDHRDAEMRNAKRALVTELAALASDAGMSIAQLALAFVLDDPTVSSAIIGPRTLEQLAELLAIGPLALPDGVRAHIDLIVSPNRNVNPADSG